MNALVPAGLLGNATEIDHPDTKQPYHVEKPLDILRVPNLDEVVAWIASFKAQPTPASTRASFIPPNGDVTINPRVIQELGNY